VSFGTEAEVSWELSFSIRIVAVGTGPVVEGLVTLALFFFSFILGVIFRSILLFPPRCLLLLFFLIFLGGVEFANPPLDAAQVEGQETLFAVPEGGPLINSVVADQALDLGLAEALDELLALFCQVVGGAHKVLVVEFDTTLFMVILSFLLPVLVAVDILDLLRFTGQVQVALRELTFCVSYSRLVPA
jgi:hypothetical protein